MIGPPVRPAALAWPRHAGSLLRGTARQTRRGHEWEGCVATVREFSAARGKKVLSAERALGEKRLTAELHSLCQGPDRPPDFCHTRSASMRLPRSTPLHNRNNRDAERGPASSALLTCAKLPSLLLSGTTEGQTVNFEDETMGGSVFIDGYRRRRNVLRR